MALWTGSPRIHRRSSMALLPESPTPRSPAPCNLPLDPSWLPLPVPKQGPLPGQQKASSGSLSYVLDVSSEMWRRMLSRSSLKEKMSQKALCGRGTSGQAVMEPPWRSLTPSSRHPPCLLVIASSPLFPGHFLENPSPLFPRGGH